MLKNSKTLIILLILFAWLPVGYAGAVATGDEMAKMSEPVNDPKKKKAGETCTTSDECQWHHTCAKTQGKRVCTAPPVTVIPNT